MINLADLEDIAGRPEAALKSLERAYGAMGRRYDAQAVRIRSWHARLGVMIARWHLAAGRRDRAETCLREVLAEAPLDAEATVELASLLEGGGDRPAAVRLCREMSERAGPADGCARFRTGA